MRDDYLPRKSFIYSKMRTEEREREKQGGGGGQRGRRYIAKLPLRDSVPRIWRGVQVMPTRNVFHKRAHCIRVPVSSRMFRKDLRLV